ncbi:MAG: DUF1127 domain-containing protein [Acetobacteraceae bacterium]|nr:DUF1127 domain-containing protein [Acetobacteraceae bacterium]MBV8578798.1 DUF1127 domain-containing protein [Acetobacteraceae bacterium]
MITRAVAVHAAHLFRFEAGHLRALLRFLVQMARTIEERGLLAEMDDRTLKDIGISRLDALAEIRRAPWDFGPRRERR